MSEIFQKAIIHKNNGNKTNYRQAIATTHSGMSAFIIKDLKHHHRICFPSSH